MKKTALKIVSNLSIALLFAAIAVVSPVLSPVSAQYGRQPETPRIMIDKMVAVPHATKGGKTDFTYVDNLSTNNYRYSPDGYVFFKITVKNTSNLTLENVVVTDQGPQYVQMLENPGKVNGNTLTFDAGTLTPGQSRGFIVKGRIAAHGSLPADRGLICVTNRAVAASNGGGNGSVSDSDTAQFCIEKTVTTSKGGVPTNVPQAGPEHAMALYAAAGALSYLGLKLRKTA